MIPCTLFLYFFIYSVLGWILETIYCRILDGKWTNRGFMTGPYCPIYGFGSLLIIYFLNIFKAHPIAVFFLGMIFTSLLEYISSFVLEKLFNAKWWDYSERKFNINGRICLRNSTMFAVLGILLTYIVHPFISTQIDKLPDYLAINIAISLFILMIIDCISSIFVLLNLKEKLVLLKDFSKKLKLDIDENSKAKKSQINKAFNEFKEKSLLKRDYFTERFLNAFPNFEFIDFKKQLDEFKEQLNAFREEQKEKRLKTKAKLSKKKEGNEKN